MGCLDLGYMTNIRKHHELGTGDRCGEPCRIRLSRSYAVLIALSRVIVVAHHPSDVLAGAIAGGIGALLVRYWLAARGLGFAIRADGTVAPLPGPSWARLKRVARSLAGQ